jgi:predicted O-methyltransferase YrrM
MTFHLLRKDWAFLIGVIVLLGLIAVVARALSYDPLLATLVVGIALVMFAILEVYRRLGVDARAEEQRRLIDYRHIESLFSVFAATKAEAPLPRMRSWAAGPDLLATTADVILREKPNLVVEMGSGVSTLVIAYCLRRNGKGRVISLEHDPAYAAATQATITAHGLGDIARVVEAPLAPVQLTGGTWQWYNRSALPSETIDVVVVDGPPGKLQALSRYPAVPLLADRLRPGSVIILDDGRRADERAIVERWRKDQPGLQVQFIETEKGAYVCRLGGA